MIYSWSTADLKRYQKSFNPLIIDKKKSKIIDQVVISKCTYTGNVKLLMEQILDKMYDFLFYLASIQKNQKSLIKKFEKFLRFCTW